MTVSFRLGIAGLGTVGASVVRMVERRRAAFTAAGLDLLVTAVSSRDRTRDRGLDLAGIEWFDDPVALARSGSVDCVVELIGGAEGPAKAVVEAALDAGKPVVTANKALLARHGAALATRAEDKGVALAFEAAVAGGIPVIKTLREGLPGNTISRVYGILTAPATTSSPHGARGPDLRGLPEGCAGPGLRRGRSDLRRRRFRHGPQARDSDEPGLRDRGRRRGRVGGGHLPGAASRPAHGGRARLPDQAPRRRAGGRGRHRAAGSTRRWCRNPPPSRRSWA